MSTGRFRWRRVRAMARKEAWHILRDKRSLMMALALPALMLLLFGWALTLDVDRLPILVLDQDRTPASRELISLFEGSRYFDILGEADDYSVLEDFIDQERALGGLAVPPGFQRDLKRGQRPAVQFLLDGSDSNTASIGLGYAENVINQFSRRIDLPRPPLKVGNWPSEVPLEVDLRIWFNPELESKNYVVPGLVGVILMLIAALLTSLTIAREQESGTLEQLLSTPVRPAEIILGKMAAYFGLGIVDALIAVVVGVTVFQVPLRGSLLLLAAACALFLFGALCWGILISAAADSQLLAYQLGMLSSFLPAFLLSGFVFAIENMPRPIQAVTYLVPARYLISILQGIYLKASGLELLAWEFGLLAIFGAAVFLIATRALSRKAVT
ncbi:MAG TPA: ABC transporter permease [Acidobacteriota bacterium]|nr:ABC transporter permease [Acidobacteriota bacterium]